MSKLQTHGPRAHAVGYSPIATPWLVRRARQHSKKTSCAPCKFALPASGNLLYRRPVGKTFNSEKRMKQILLTLAVFAAALVPSRASTLLPYLDNIRAEIVNQQTIVSNAPPPLDKPLATALRKALFQIDRPTPTNIVNDTKALASIAKTLNKTSVSNVFDPLIRSALINYADEVMTRLVAASNTVASTFPSGPHTAANNLIAQAFDAVESALANSDTTAGAKALAAVTKKLTAISNVVAKAETAKAPPARINARVTGSLNTTIKTAAAGIAPGVGLNIGGAQPQGAGFKQINFVLNNVPEGTSTVPLTFGNVNILSLGGAINYGNGTGTATVTRNNANSTAFGTFTFTASGVGGTTGTVTVTGDFFGTW